MSFGLGSIGEILARLEKGGTIKTRYSNSFGKADFVLTLASIADLGYQAQTNPKGLGMTPQRFMYTLIQKFASLTPGVGGVAVDGLDIIMNNFGLLDYLDKDITPPVLSNPGPMKIHPSSSSMGRMY